MEKTASIRVELSRDSADRSYDIVIREGILDELASGSVPLPDAKSYFIVTDSTVARLYGKKLREKLSKSGRKVELVSFQGGEENKSVETVWKVASSLNRLGADRGSVVLALGGGVVGDLAGFVASIYKRGVPYVQLPTTLLAQVDSSVGGKTGVDAPWGKNQLGTFYQPVGVMTDPSALRTLPRSEMMNGLGEIVKCAMIADREMFERVSVLAPKLGSGVPTDLIAGACRVKAEVVSRDEKEQNLRAILNYGHTVGHAIESSSNYRMSHGLSVMLGMIAEGSIAVGMGILQEADFEKQSDLVLELLRGAGARGLRDSVNDKKKLLRFALADKKTTSSSLRMSLPERIGRMYTTKDGSHKIPVSQEAFMQSIDYLRKALPSKARVG